MKYFLGTTKFGGNFPRMLSRGYGPAVVPYHITDGDGKITEATS